MMTPEEARARAEAIVAELRAHPEVAEALAAMGPPRPAAPAPASEPRRAIDDISEGIKAAIRGGANAHALRAEQLMLVAQGRRTLAQKISDGGFRLEERCMRAVVAPTIRRTAPSLEVGRALRWWREGERRGCLLVLASPERGLGKTASAARGVLLACERPQFACARDVASTPNNAWPENREAWARWGGADGLVLDELGLEGEGDDLTAVTGLLFSRYQRGAFTVATTNLPYDAIRARYLQTEAGQSLLHRVAFAQGAMVMTPQGPRAGEGGLVWFRTVAGPNLRDAAVRAALEAQEARGPRESSVFEKNAVG